MTTRRLLLTGTAIGLLGAFAPRWRPSLAAAGAFEVAHSDAEWRTLLTSEQYAVLRQNGTENPFTSPLLDEHRAGIFACAGCAQTLYASTTKFESGTGWPSFWAPIEGAVARPDATLGHGRTAVHLQPMRRPSRPCLR